MLQLPQFAGMLMEAPLDSLPVAVGMLIFDEKYNVTL
jgi:hypothetical protein